MRLELVLENNFLLKLFSFHISYISPNIENKKCLVEKSWGTFLPNIPEKHFSLFYLSFYNSLTSAYMHYHIALIKISCYNKISLPFHFLTFYSELKILFCHDTRMCVYVCWELNGNRLRLEYENFNNFSIATHPSSIKSSLLDFLFMNVRMFACHFYCSCLKFFMTCSREIEEKGNQMNRLISPFVIFFFFNVAIDKISHKICI